MSGWKGDEELEHRRRSSKGWTKGHLPPLEGIVDVLTELLAVDAGVPLGHVSMGHVGLGGGLQLQLEALQLLDRLIDRRSLCLGRLEGAHCVALPERGMQGKNRETTA